MKKLILLSFSLLIFSPDSFAQAEKTTETIKASYSVQGLEDGFYRGIVKIINLPDPRINPDRLYRLRVAGNTVSMIDFGDRTFKSMEFQTYNTDTRTYNKREKFIRKENYTYDATELTAQIDQDGNITAYQGFVTIYYDNGRKIEYEVIIPVE